MAERESMEESGVVSSNHNSLILLSAGYRKPFFALWSSVPPICEMINGISPVHFVELLLTIKLGDRISSENGYYCS